MKLRIKNQNESKLVRGFTLVETLVAVFILVFALLGPLALAIYSIRAASVSKNEIVAYNLAQEAMEYVRNVRDKNFITGGTWNNGLTSCTGPFCGVDLSVGATTVFGSCANMNNCVLKYNTATGEYNAQTGSNTIFTRKIEIQMGADYSVPSDGVPDELMASTTVSWSEKAVQKKINLETHLFNWK